MAEQAPGRSAAVHPAATARATLLLGLLPDGTLDATETGAAVHLRRQGLTIRVLAGDIGGITGVAEDDAGNAVAVLDAPSVAAAAAWVESLCDR